MPSSGASAAATVSAEILARLACPACHGSLAPDAGVIRCIQCERRYPIHDGIPVLIAGRASGAENH